MKARMLLIQQYPTPDNIDGTTIAEIVSLKVLVVINLVYLVNDLLHYCFCTTFAQADSETV